MFNVSYNFLNVQHQQQFHLTKDVDFCCCCHSSATTFEDFSAVFFFCLFFTLFRPGHLSAVVFLHSWHFGYFMDVCKCVCV